MIKIVNFARFCCPSEISKGIYNSLLKTCERNMYTIAVEGNIGSGKTTLLQYFSNFPSTTVIQEPVERWRNINGYNLLDLMYQEPTRWSLTFQTYVQLTMLQNHKKVSNTNIKLMERSIYSAKYCFVENLYQSGLMPKVEYLVLTEWFNWLISNKDLKIDLIVYLRTKPEVAYKRIQERCRIEEKAISMDYLKSLHDLHEKWLTTKSDFVVPAPVLILDANCELSDMQDTFRKYTCDILFQNKHSPISGKASSQ
ncbi:thymidine kinase 2, mitochondrial-like [Centruroides sculpturatus]|uniref:thymidine kinase 2, mitochondrial-like n=1 Tax=Centruroides sculpturatus TaxID=218467 RepID=UPI000C6CDDDA|nr:thymidine kinase 2, mitochondrial-like [Centruroides sculpturatus]